MEKRKVLLNPIIWDSHRNLLIDGHHRIEALALLGATQVPAYHVDYTSSHVAVDQWIRIIKNVQPSRLKEIFELLRMTEPLPIHDQVHRKKWLVKAETVSGTIIAARKFTTPRTASAFVNWICDYCTSQHGIVELSAELKSQISVSANATVITINPPIGKHDIISAINEKFLFPYQVNRHVIKNRLLGLSFPIRQLVEKRNLSSIHLDKHLKNACLSFSAARSWHDRRFYEEPTIILNF